MFQYTQNDYFGELALLKDEPRAATIKATVSYFLYTILKKIRAHSESRGWIEALSKDFWDPLNLSCKEIPKNTRNS